MVIESSPKAIRISPVDFGLDLGLKTGARLSISYAIIIVMAETMRVLWLSGDLRILGYPITVFACFPLILLLIAPAFLLGLITGALMGKLWTIVKTHCSEYAFAVLGSIACTGIVIILHITLEIPVDFTLIPTYSGGELGSFGLLESYPFMLLVPSVIYIIAGAWGSLRLYRAMED